MSKLRRWFCGWWEGFSEWVSGKDTCEICGNEKADYICVGCEKRICMMCESGYYSDAELCTECRKDISPEEYAEDCRDKAEELAEECYCFLGNDPDNKPCCMLTEEEHQFINKWKAKVTPCQ